MTPADEELPVLTPDIVEDDELLGVAVDGVVLADPVAKARASEIVEAQTWLRDAVDAEAWRLFLEVDARQTERWADVLLVVARWAFAEGRRFPLVPGEDGDR